MIAEELENYLVNSLHYSQFTGSLNGPCIRYIYCYINENAGIFFANLFATEFTFHIFKEE